MFAQEITLPAKVYSSATLTLDSAGLPEFVGEPSSNSIAGPITLAIRDGVMLKHYFHWVEILLATYILHQEYYSQFPINRLLVGNQIWNNPSQNNIQAKMLKRLYGDIEIVEGHCCLGEQFENVLVVDRLQFRHGSGGPKTLNKFLEPFLPIGARHARSFREKIVSSIPPIDVVHRAVHVKRTPPRAFSPELGLQVEALIGGDALDFADLSWEEQVAHSSRSDLFYGVHGNGLTNIIWMKAGAAVLEFFPERAHHYDYQIFSELFGLRYFGFQGLNLWREFSRHGPAIGHRPEEVNAPVTEVNWPAVKLALSAISVI